MWKCCSAFLRLQALISSAVGAFTPGTTGVGRVCVIAPTGATSPLGPMRNAVPGVAPDVFVQVLSVRRMIVSERPRLKPRKLTRGGGEREYPQHLAALYALPGHKSPPQMASSDHTKACEGNSAGNGSRAPFDIV